MGFLKWFTDKPQKISPEPPNKSIQKSKLLAELFLYNSETPTDMLSVLISSEKTKTQQYKKLFPLRNSLPEEEMISSKVLFCL